MTCLARLWQELLLLGELPPERWDGDGFIKKLTSRETIGATLHLHHDPHHDHHAPHTPLGTHRAAAPPRLRPSRPSSLVRRAATAIAGPVGFAGKEMRTTYFKRARECTDSDLNGVKLYEYEAGS